MGEPSGEDSVFPSNESNGSIEAERAFDAPWQARAFAVAVAMTREGEGSWGSFQERLAAEVEREDADTSTTDAGTGGAETDPESAYYEQWLGALTRLLIDSGTLTAAEITARAREFAEGERTAEEWIEGERDHVHEGHAHGDEYGHPHDH